jgi:hypothetical protein
LALKILEQHDQTKKLWFECLGNYIFMLISQNQEVEAKKNLEIFSSNLFSIHENDSEVLLLKDFLVGCFDVKFQDTKEGMSKLTKTADATTNLLLIEKISSFASEHGNDSISSGDSEFTTDSLNEYMTQYQLDQLYLHYKREPTKEELEALDLIISRGFNPVINKRMPFVKKVFDQTERDYIEIENNLPYLYQNQDEQREIEYEQEYQEKKRPREFGFLKKKPFDDL